MGKQEGTVRGLQFRAIAALRRELGIDRPGRRSDRGRRAAPGASRMDDDEMYVMDAGEIELERRFDAFARARLSPDPAATARIRARVMREARLHHDAARIALHMAPAIEARHRSSVRRLGVPLLAATVWLGIAAGSIAAAQAGGPLYPDPDVARDGDAPGVRERPGDGGPPAPRRPARARRSPPRPAAIATRPPRRSRPTRKPPRTPGRTRSIPASQPRSRSALEHHVAVLTAVADGLAAKGNDTAAERDRREHRAGDRPQRGGARHAGEPPGRTRSGERRRSGNGNGSGERERRRERNRRRQRQRRWRRTGRRRLAATAAARPAAAAGRAARHRTRRRRPSRSGSRRPHRSPAIPARRTSPTSRSTPRADRTRSRVDLRPARPRRGPRVVVAPRRRGRVLPRPDAGHRDPARPGAGILPAAGERHRAEPSRRGRHQPPPSRPLHRSRPAPPLPRVPVPAGPPDAGHRAGRTRRPPRRAARRARVHRGRAGPRAASRDPGSRSAISASKRGASPTRTTATRSACRRRTAPGSSTRATAGGPGTSPR